MRYKTKEKIKTNTPEIGSIRYRNKFIFFPVKAKDGYTYFLQRVYVKELYHTYFDLNFLVIGWEVQDVIKGAQ